MECAIDHWRGAVIAAVPAAIATAIAAAMAFAVISGVATTAAAMIFRIGRRRKCSQHKKRGDCKPSRERHRQVAFRFGIDDVGHK